MENFNSKNLSLISIEDRNLKLGITIIAFGFFKKMFFAYNIAPLVNDIFSNPMGLESFTIILGTIGFAFQIYADFSGSLILQLEAVVLDQYELMDVNVFHVHHEVLFLSF